MFKIIIALLALIFALSAGARAATQATDDTASDKVDLSQALEVAVKRVHGRVVDAKRASHNGHAAWDVALDRRGEPVHVWVDAQTGAIEIEKSATP